MNKKTLSQLEDLRDNLSIVISGQTCLDGDELDTLVSLLDTVTDEIAKKKRLN